MTAFHSAKQSLLLDIKEPSVCVCACVCVYIYMYYTHTHTHTHSAYIMEVSTHRIDQSLGTAMEAAVK